MPWRRVDLDYVGHAVYRVIVFECVFEEGEVVGLDAHDAYVLWRGRGDEGQCVVAWEDAVLPDHFEGGVGVGGLAVAHHAHLPVGGVDCWVEAQDVCVGQALEEDEHALVGGEPARGEDEVGYDEVEGELEGRVVFGVAEALGEAAYGLEVEPVADSLFECVEVDLHVCHGLLAQLGLVHLRFREDDHLVKVRKSLGFLLFPIFSFA